MKKTKGCHMRLILAICLVLLAFQLNIIVVATTPPPKVVWLFHSEKKIGCKVVAVEKEINNKTFSR